MQKQVNQLDYSNQTIYVGLDVHKTQFTVSIPHPWSVPRQTIRPSKVSAGTLRKRNTKSGYK